MTPDTFPLLDIDALAKIPPAAWLVDQVVPEGLTPMFGASGVGKSFVSTDFGLSVASGTPWFGHSVRQGRVVYLVGEGASGLHKRIHAWETRRGVLVPRDAFHVMPYAANLLDRDVLAKVNRTLAGLDGVRLLIVDTLARYMPGGDENSSRDMGLFVHAIDHLRAIHGSSALVVHHSGRSGEHERGSTALEGAADCRLHLRGDSNSLQLRCLKIKDHKQTPTVSLRLEPVAGSLVVDRLSGRETVAASGSDIERKLLATVSAVCETDALDSRAIADASGLPKSTANRGLNSLFAQEAIGRIERGQTYYWFDPATTVPDRPKPSHGTTRTEPSHTHPFRGGTGRSHETDSTRDWRTA